MTEEYEFEVTCHTCGQTDWLFGTEEEERRYDEDQDYICFKCYLKKERKENKAIKEATK